MIHWRPTLIACIALHAAGPLSIRGAEKVDIKSGRQWWAFQPVSAVQPPALHDDRWSRSDMDRFILARLKQAGLRPSPAADRRTLLRRATFDLTGLPPTQAEVDTFVADSSPDAFARVIERLLASPHYGEHWARHWLDVARYSDTKGYVYAREEKNFIQASPYRDWVVNALNADMPYDQFLLRQIAADQIEPAGSPHLAAMGFLTLGRRFLGVTQDIIDDRIDVLMSTTQALTVGCARCHDHKFDPIPTSDYYSLYGIFRSCAEEVVPCSAPDAGTPEFQAGLRERQNKLQQALTKRREEQAMRVRNRIADHLLAQLELDKYPDETFTQIIAEGDINPVFVRRWQTYLTDAAKQKNRIFKAWHEFEKITPQDFAAKTQALKTLPPKALHPVVKQLFLTAPSSMKEVAERYGTLLSRVHTQWQDLQRKSPTATALPSADDEELRQVLYAPDSPCAVPDEHLANNEWFFPTTIVVELWKLQAEVDRWLIQSPNAPAYTTILTDRSAPATTRIFLRGNPLTKGSEVSRHFLQALTGENPSPFTQGSGRLELARAIASPTNPLTARVMVNRVWAQHFGKGLVATPSDFGKRAEPPSHPDLLDWLARRFMTEGWSLKELHRCLMLSATYQQSSFGPENASDLARAQEIDAENRLLWRMNTHRLSFEEMRDAALAASGELAPKIGGRPTDLFASANKRRTLYAKIDREHLPSVLSTFNFANPDLSIPVRNDTIAPQQALFGLNHPFLAARAKALTAKLSTTANTSNLSKLSQLYSNLYQRPPSAVETSAALTFLNSQPPVKKSEPSSWIYGFGEWDEAAGKVKSFTPLPHFTGSAWQGGDAWPDAKLGWAQLTATGGHPGNNRQHAVIRRWIAPHDGMYGITSKLIHEPTAGDGIRAFISHSNRGLLRSCQIHHSSEQLDLDPIALAKGEHLDFVVDIHDGLNSDQFLWSPKITSTEPALLGDSGESRSWSANTDFRLTGSDSLTPWQQLAQTLLLANEFVFID